MRLENNAITIFDLWEMMKGNEHHLIGKSILKLTKKLNQPELPKNFRITADIFNEKISIISDRGIEIVTYLDIQDINDHISTGFINFNPLDSRFVLIIPILDSTPLKLGQSICHDIYWEARRTWLYDYNHDTI